MNLLYHKSLDENTWARFVQPGSKVVMSMVVRNLSNINDRSLESCPQASCGGTWPRSTLPTWITCPVCSKDVFTSPVDIPSVATSNEHTRQSPSSPKKDCEPRAPKSTASRNAADDVDEDEIALFRRIVYEILTTSPPRQVKHTLAIPAPQGRNHHQGLQDHAGGPPSKSSIGIHSARSASLNELSDDQLSGGDISGDNFFNDYFFDNVSDCNASDGYISHDDSSEHMSSHDGVLDDGTHDNSPDDFSSVFTSEGMFEDLIFIPDVDHSTETHFTIPMSVALFGLSLPSSKQIQTPAANQSPDLDSINIVDDINNFINKHSLSTERENSVLGPGF